VGKGPLPAADRMTAVDLDHVSAGGNVEIVGTKQYIVMRGVDPYRDFLKDPSQPWDLQFGGTVDVDTLRKRLLQIQGLKEPTLITVRGTLYPCALLSPGWWDRQAKDEIMMPDWHDSLQKWLFYGFDLWGPSWDFSWNFGASAQDKPNPYFITQLGDGDEADSIPVIVPHDKAEKLKDKFQEGWGGLEVAVTGLLGHRRQFSQEVGSIDLVGGLLDYCIWMKEGEKGHKISPLIDKTDIYSGYLWKCVAPKKWFEENKTLSLNRVYFIWEHTNFTEKDSINYNLDSLEHKESYIRSMHGDLILVQKSSSLVPGRPEWSYNEIYNLLMRKKGEDI